jgi:predicted small metal-binding protein
MELIFDNMTSIRCPICKTAVSGDGETVLTHNLRDHMASVHEIKDLCELNRGNLPLGSETHAPPQDRGPEDWEKIKRSGSAISEMEIGEDVEESVLCPFCGSRVFGHDGDDLSNKLHDHIEDVHDLKPSRILPHLKY